MYYIVFAIWYLFSLLPLWVHYLISDVLYLFIYKIVGYRTAVVRKNLSSSFPNKSEEELRDIEHRFYRWFCDYLVETVKMFLSLVLRLFGRDCQNVLHIGEADYAPYAL